VKQQINMKTTSFNAPRDGFFGFRGVLLAAVLPLGAHGGASAAVDEAAGGIWETAREQGIKASLAATGEFWSNADGGVDRGSEWNYLLDASVELDLATLFGGPEGGSVVVQLFNVQNSSGRCFAERSGSINPASGIHAGDQVRFYNVHYRQEWADGAVVLKLGQQAADDDFMGSDFAGLFMNSSFGAMPSQVATPLAEKCFGTSAYPIYAVAAPGSFVAVKPNDVWLFQMGAYVGSPGGDVSGNHGFDWEISPDAGVACFYEAGMSYHIGGLPGGFKLGGTLHSGLFDDFEARNAGVEDATVRGIHSFYLVADQTLIAGGDDGAVLGAFWRSGFSPLEDRSVVSTYHDVGIVWNGPFGRDGDALGLAVANTRVGGEFARDAGSGRDEWAIELTYRAAVTSWMEVQGGVQWLLDPVFSEAAGGDDQALVFGLRTGFSF
jgi:porin